MGNDQGFNYFYTLCNGMKIATCVVSIPRSSCAYQTLEDDAILIENIERDIVSLKKAIKEFKKRNSYK